MPGPSRRHPVLTFVVLLGVLGATTLAARSIAKVRWARIVVPLDEPRAFGELTTAVPTGWRLDPRASEVRAGSAILVQATSPAGTGVADPKHPEVVEGGRVLTVALERPEHVVPPLEYLVPAGISGDSGSMVLAGRPAPFVALAVKSAGPNGQRSFVLEAASTLQSGKVVAVKLAGPGNATERDQRLFLRVVESTVVPSESSSVPADPLDSLRLKSGSWSPAVAVIDGEADDTMTVEAFPVVLSPRGKAATSQPASGPSNAAVANEYDASARAIVRFLSSLQSPEFSVGSTFTRTPSGLLAAPASRGAYEVLTLTVWSPHEPGKGALLVARGPGGSDVAIKALLERAAQHLVFGEAETKAGAGGGVGEMVESGTGVAAAVYDDAPSVPAAGDWAAIWSEGKSVVGWSRLGDEGTVETRGERGTGILVARRTVTQTITRALRVDMTWEVLEKKVLIPLKQLYLTIPPRNVIQVRRSELDLQGMSQFVPAHRLFDAIAACQGRSSVLVTDTLPWMSLEHQVGVFMLVVEAVAEGASKGSTNAYILGTSRVLNVTFGSDGRPTALAWSRGPVGQATDPKGDLDKLLSDGGAPPERP